jgi:hypothetical protein
MSRMRVRARALDMLGRQQMAGIPSAIHELFKNAHDAYADNVRVDFFRRSRMLLMWDDGVGMTFDDFEQRWLTLGTESKIGGGELAAPYKDPNKPERPILGEKGIGRLAVATIGPQVLIITRARRDDGLHNPVVSFINWSVFEAGGINLEEIEVPVKSLRFPPDKDSILELLGITEKNIREIESRLPADLVLESGMNCNFSGQSCLIFFGLSPQLQ